MKQAHDIKTLYNKYRFNVYVKASVFNILIFMQKRKLDSSRIRALALDLDGTALGAGAGLSGRTEKALRSCRERGIGTIICTGRGLESAEKYRRPIEAEGPMVYFNGAIVADMPQGKILSAVLLESEAADFCIGLSRETGAYFQLFLPQKDGTSFVLAAESRRPETGMYLNHTGVDAVICDLREAVNAPGFPGCVKGMFIAEPEIQELLKPRLKERLGNTVYIVRTFRNFLEILNSKVSKGEGLKTAMKARGLKSEEVIALGDEENDLPMFSVAGFSVAPSNAGPAVLEAADLVIGANTEDGTAEFLEKTFLF
jgi:Cof subfamily protein (haloacid dehalogenase superfamily)